MNRSYTLRQTGNTTYNGSVECSTRLRSSKLEITSSQGFDLPLGILLVTFDLNRGNDETSTQNNKNLEHKPKSQRMKTRKSVRDRHFTKRLQVNPRQKFTITLKRGGVRDEKEITLKGKVELSAIGRDVTWRLNKFFFFHFFYFISVNPCFLLK